MLKGLSSVSISLKKWLRDVDKLVILGVGNPLRSDDKVGVLIIESLNNNSSKVKIINCREVPENYLGEIINYNPEKILFIDGISAGLPVGEPIFLQFTQNSPQEDITLSTHSLPLQVSANFIQNSIGASTALLGIQVASTNFGKKLHSSVKKTADSLTSLLNEILSNSLNKYVYN
jgi:hydrogenase 3 maturation protease